MPSSRRVDGPGRRAIPHIVEDQFRHWPAADRTMGPFWSAESNGGGHEDVVWHLEQCPQLGFHAKMKSSQDPAVPEGTSREEDVLTRREYRSTFE